MVFWVSVTALLKDLLLKSLCTSDTRVSLIVVMSIHRLNFFNKSFSCDFHMISDGISKKLDENV